MKQVHGIYEWLRALDWRIWVVVLSTVLAILVTLPFYYYGVGLDPNTHFGSIFAGWVSGVALFVAAGAVVAIVSLARPERESFDSRARILFRRQTGKHIDYIVDKMRDVLEHYAESLSIRVTVVSYHAGEKKYLLALSDCMVLRSYIDDVDTAWESHFDYSEITPPPEGEQRGNCLVYMRVDGVPLVAAERFSDQIRKPISTRIERNKSCKIEYLAEHWIRADDEPHEHRPTRYNQSVTLEFENITSVEKPITIQVSQDGEKWVDVILAPGEVKKGLELMDVRPGTKAYEYRVMSPT
jgi:hypothetical protein